MQMHYGVKTLPDRCSKHPTLSLSLVQVFVTTESVQMYNCLALIINIGCTLTPAVLLLLPPPVSPCPRMPTSLPQAPFEHVRAPTVNERQTTAAMPIAKHPRPTPESEHNARSLICRSLNICITIYLVTCNN